MLDQIRHLFGENAPERLLFQYFQKQEENWKARVSKGSTLLHKAQLFSKVREKEGLFLRCIHDDETGRIVLREYHHPLHHVFSAYPRTVALEQRAVEAALGVKISREVPESVGDVRSFVDFVLVSG